MIDSSTCRRRARRALQPFRSAIAVSLPVGEDAERLPQTGEKGIYLKQNLKDKLIEHKQYIDKYGPDLAEIRNWKWKG